MTYFEEQRQNIVDKINKIEMKMRLDKEMGRHQNLEIYLNQLKDLNYVLEDLEEEFENE